MQTTGVYDYDSHILAAYLQDDWRVNDRLTVNLGSALRPRHQPADERRSTAGALQDPQYRGLENFVSADRGNDYNNFQPRLGVTYDINGKGTLVARGGWGMYVTRHRHYFGLTAQDRLLGVAVRIEDPNLLRNYPSISGVLGGKSLIGLRARAAPPARSTSSPTTTCCRSRRTPPPASAGRSTTRPDSTSTSCTPTATTSSARSTSTCRRPAGSAPTNPRPVPPVHRGQEPRELLQELVQRARDPAADAAARARQPAGLLHPVAQLPRRRQPLPDLRRHDADAAGEGLQRHGLAPQPVDRRVDDACRGASR